MTTPILEPLLAVTVATPVSAQREAPADDRAFRDLLAPPAKSPGDAPPKNSQTSNDEWSQPPVCSAPPADETSATEEKEEKEEAASDDAAAVTISAPAISVETEIEAEVDLEFEGVVQVDSDSAESDVPTETPPPAADLPSAERLQAAAENVSATQHDALAVEVEETAPVTPHAVGQIEVRDGAAIDAEVATVAHDAPGEEETSTSIEADIIASEMPATEHAALAQQESPQRENASQGDRQAASPNDSETANAFIAAGQAPEPTAAAKRPAGRARESEKRDGKDVGEVEDKNATSEAPESPTLNAAKEPAPHASTTPVIAETAVEAQPNAAVEAASARAEASAVLGTPPATAERLGTMLAQRRVKMSAGSHGPALTESQQARLVQRVARAFETARMRGDAEIRLRLSPPELGALKLEVRMESGVLTARLEVETVAAQQALSDNLGTLRQRLAEQQIRVEQFDIDLMDRHNGNPSDSPTSQFSHDERHAQRGAARTPRTEKTSHTASAVVEPRAATRASGGLDVLI